MFDAVRRNWYDAQVRAIIEQQYGYDVWPCLSSVQRKIYLQIISNAWQGNIPPAVTAHVLNERIDTLLTLEAE